MTKVLGEEPVTKLETDLASALRRRPLHEPFLAGTLRQVAGYSPRLLAALGRSIEVFVRRRSFERPLYAAAAATLAEHEEAAVVSHLADALVGDEAGGLSTLSAASLTRSPAIGRPLAVAAANRHPHVVVGAELARVARGESNGEQCASVAARLNESARISLCAQLFVPRLWQPPLSPAIAPGLFVLRESERNLGRWLVLARLAQAAGDTRAPLEARHHLKAVTGASRAAWNLVCWVLEGHEPPSSVRPNLALVTRLSDRPKGDRDVGFLFRMGEAHLASAKPMLVRMMGPPPLSEANSVRAALVLGRTYGQKDVIEPLIRLARSRRHEVLRGLAAAALFDLGERDLAGHFADELVNSSKLPCVGWAALIRAGSAAKVKTLVTEPAFRRIQIGWSE